MDMVAKIGLLGDGMQDILRHVLGVARGETHAHVGYRLRHLAQQFGKGADMQFFSAFFLDDDAVLRALAVRQQSVAVDVLSEQCHLFEAVVVEVAYLGKDALHVARALASTGVRHDAVVAEVVAATHDAHEATDVVAADTCGDDAAVGLCRREVDVDGRQSLLG